MPRATSFLQRFRRLLAPPGRATEAVGVPASGQELAGELGPVLDRLDTVDAEASAIEERARERAARRRDQGEREAAAILAEVQMRADAERGRAASEQRVEAQRVSAAAHAEAEREVQRIRALREERVAQLVDEVIQCVRRGEG